MNREEILKLVSSLQEQLKLDRELIFGALEEALSASLSRPGQPEEHLVVRIHRDTGQVRALRGGRETELPLTRATLQQARRLFLQKIREVKNRGVFEELASRQGTIVVGKILTAGPDAITVELGGGVEGILPRREWIPGESHLPGTYVRAQVLELDRTAPVPRLLLSRATPEFVVRLFELEVPEIQNGTCEIVATARDPGFRTKILVRTTKPGVDCVGACVGQRGSRIKNVTAELNGEKIDVIPWNDDEVERVRLAMKPAEIVEVQADRRRRKAVLYVAPGGLSQAIGRSGRNVRLAAKLTGWEIDLFELPAQETADRPLIQSGRGQGAAAPEGRGEKE